MVVSHITHFGNPKKITFKSFEKNMSNFIYKIDVFYLDNVCDRNDYLQRSLV